MQGINLLQWYWWCLVAGRNCWEKLRKCTDFVGDVDELIFFRGVAQPQTSCGWWFQTCFYFHNRRKFRSQTSDNMDRWKAEQGRGREKRKIRRKKSRRERVRKQKMQMREKVGKSRNTAFFQWFVAPEGRKVGSLKRRVRSQLARWEMKNCTPLWREAHFQVNMYKTHHGRTTFGSWDVEKVHAVVARSTFRSENVQKTRGSDHFWRFRCRFAASLHYTTLRYITPHSTILHYITLHYTPQHYNYNYTTRLHSTTLHYIEFHYTTLHYTTLHYTTLH